MTLKLSAIGAAALIAREGRALAAYKDSKGIWTIGIGHTAAAGPPIPKAGVRITSAECDALFARDVQRYAEAVGAALHVPLAAHETDALISLCYNIGPRAFAGSSAARMLNAGSDRKAVASAILMWSKPAAVRSRREGEADQFLTPYPVALPRARRSDVRPVSVATTSSGRAGAIAPSSGADRAPTVVPIEPVHAAPPGGWFGRFGAWIDRVLEPQASRPT